MGAILIEDSRQQESKHDLKHEWWSSHGIDIVRHKLDVGDYMTVGSSVTVDTKASLSELAMDLGKDHKRFRRELERAKEQGLQLVILIESSDRFNDRAVLAKWPGRCSFCALYKAHRCHPRAHKCVRYRTVPMQGHVMAKQIETMSAKYGVEFRFCEPEESARIVCELLGLKTKT